MWLFYGQMPAEVWTGIAEKTSEKRHYEVVLEHQFEFEQWEWKGENGPGIAGERYKIGSMGIFFNLLSVLQKFHLLSNPRGKGFWKTRNKTK